MRRLKMLGRVYLCVMLGFLYLPIAVLIAYSFNESKSRAVFTNFTLKWYGELAGNDMILKSLAVSLVIAFASAAIATVVGTLAAVGVNGMSRRARTAVMVLSYVPVINPEIITGVSLMLQFVVGNTQLSNLISALLGAEVSVNGLYGGSI